MYKSNIGLVFSVGVILITSGLGVYIFPTGLVQGGKGP